MRVLGHNPDNIDANECLSMVICNLKSQNPVVCTLHEFYPGVFSPNPTASVKINPRPGVAAEGIRYAEQFQALAKMGLVQDLTKESKDA